MALELGVVLHQHCPVIGAVRKATHIESLCTPKGNFAADIFIDCTNAWSPRLATTIGGSPLPISPLKRYLWFLERDGSITAEQMSTWPMVVLPSGVYFRPENPDTLMIGWAHDATPQQGRSNVSHGVVVSTQDSESCDRGSNPRGRIFHRFVCRLCNTNRLTPRREPGRTHMHIPSLTTQMRKKSWEYAHEKLL